MASKNMPETSQATSKKKKKKKNGSPPATGLNQDGEYPLSKRQTEDEWSFLDLPGEVQNTIYLAVLADSGAVLTNKLRIAMPASLSGVSKQVHAQMCGQAMYCVRAEVINFNFAKVITFLNRLSEQDVRLLKAKEGKVRIGEEQHRQARLVVHMRFNNKRSSDLELNLTRWLNRFNKVDNRASDAAFEYVGTCSDMFTHHNVYGCLERWKFSFETEHKKQHMRRIRNAVLQNWQDEHAALESSVQQQTATCTCTARQRRLRCEDCKLRDELRYMPAPGYHLGTEWVGL